MSVIPISNISDVTWCTLLNDTSKVFCVIMQTYTIPHSKVRLYDVFILFCNVIFVIFLLLQIVPTVKKLRLTWPLFSILYCLIFLIPVVCSIRGILAMILGHQHLAAKLLHYILRGIILATEISVVVFGLAIKFFIDSRLKLTVTVLIISLISLIFTTTQCLLDVLKVYYPLVCETHGLFTHGGMLFTFTYSTLFAIIYCLIFCLYVFRLYQKWNLPTKKSFYRYALFLSFVNTVQSVSSMLWFYGTKHQVIGHVGVCFIMITSLTYLITFAPVVYWIFLRNYFRMTRGPPVSDTPDSSVNINREEPSSSPGPRWKWKWSLRGKKSHQVYIPIYTDSQETSRLLDKMTPSSVESSYSSTDSIDS
ncbi:PREDICTED: transmembrane protein adipocyte-associated 1-like [Amphimedon queenslandica]|uniref:G-protein coupled receptors family 1 profile domain-containing protein n=1 Tax=Amphimedon queenslandica TaxID=400682 RepID=A0A1X7VSZ0_AMPQE|nr:PREDICTED: transmembrane protein adipocyte-associated 1-like [Amphimedon queenslandica]|eukprot:XP_019854873.1 PREDICTED: transmembrane protein adipocyte-associated 1-like [Amphimedon queenslandica]